MLLGMNEEKEEAFNAIFTMAISHRPIPPPTSPPLRDSKVAMRMADGSTMTLPPPSFVVNALEHLDLRPGQSFLDVGCGTGYVSALAACLLGDRAAGAMYGVECVSSRLEQASLCGREALAAERVSVQGMRS